MRERRRDYELLYIISSLRNSEEEISAAINRVSQAITSLGGEVTATNHASPWGRRKFAYPIREYAEGEASRRSFTEGYYVLIHFSLATDKIAELERVLKLTDAVLRYLLTLVDARSGSPGAAAVVSAASEPLEAEGDEDDEDDE
jgi:small subunit ribosomal protein S6